MIGALAIAALTLANPIARDRVAEIPHLPCTASRERAADLVVIGNYQNGALSTAWVGSQYDDTHVADLEIAPGPPIHLVIATYGHNIYRLSGDIARIRRLTLMSEFHSGVVGVPRDRVEIGGLCFRYEALYERDPAIRERAVRGFFGSDAVMAGAYTIRQARIGRQVELDPAGAVRRARIDPENDEMLTFTPGGLARIDPRRIVAIVPVGAYQTLPQEAGVRALVQQGALVRATEADARRWEARARERGVARPHAVWGLYYGVYRVVRPILVPPGLCGAHLIRLYAPSPAYIDGDPCHSTIYYDDGTAIGPDAPH